MSQLLTPEERQALRPTRAQSGHVVCAVFPNVAQMDGSRLVYLEAGLRQWSAMMAEEIGRQLHVRCHIGSLDEETRLPGTSEDAEVTLVGALNGCEDLKVKIVLPSALAAALCERMFGASFRIRDARTLTETEASALLKMVAAWIHLLPQAFPLCSAEILPVQDERDHDRTEEADGEQQESRWMYFTGTIECAAATSRITVSMKPTTARALLGEASSAGREPISTERILAELGDVPVELSAVIGTSDFSMDALCSLRTGDVITLARRVEEPFELILEGRVFLRARAGNTGHTITLEVVDFAGDEKQP